MIWFLVVGLLPALALGATLPGYDDFAIGVNYPWYNGNAGLDIGVARGSAIAADSRTSADAPWQPMPLTRNQVNANSSGWDATNIGLHLDDMRQYGIQLVRWFLCWEWYSFFAVDVDGVTVTGFTDGTLANMDAAVDMAEARGLKLIPVILDFRIFEGARRDYAAGGSEAARPELATNPTLRAALINNGVIPLVERYRGRPGIYAWELANEITNVVSGTHSVTNFPRPSWSSEDVPIEDMETLLVEMAAAIRATDPDAKIIATGLARPTQLPFVIGRIDSDIYAAHHNDFGGDTIKSIATINANDLAAYGVTVDKPLLMIEGPSTLSRDLVPYVEGAMSGGWAGYLAWTWYELIDRHSFQEYTAVVRAADRPSTALKWLSWWSLGSVLREPVSRQGVSRAATGPRAPVVRAGLGVQ